MVLTKVSFLSPLEPLYVIIEFVSGGSLDKLLRSSRVHNDNHDTSYTNIWSKLTERELLKMASDVANGMRHLESKQVTLLLLFVTVVIVVVVVCLFVFSFSRTQKVKVQEFFNFLGSLRTKINSRILVTEHSLKQAYITCTQPQKGTFSIIHARFGV